LYFGVFASRSQTKYLTGPAGKSHKKAARGPKVPAAFLSSKGVTTKTQIKLVLFQALLFSTLIIELRKIVKKEICIAGDSDDDRKLLSGGRKFKGTAVKFNDVTKCGNSVSAIALGIDDLAFIKRNAR